MNYIPNNIEFRIVSSNSIAKFRQQQAFIFNELIRNPKGSFSHSSREILLLNYDLWFKWILRTEKLFLTLIVSDYQQEASISTYEPYLSASVEHVIEEIGDVIQAAPHLFTDNVNNIVKFQRPYIDYAKSKIAAADKYTIYMAYPKIVSAITGILYNLLHIIHESERIGNDKPFLSLTKDTMDIFNDTGKLLIVERGLFYKKEFGTSEFALKNYTDKPLDPEVLTQLKEAGLTITAFL